MPESVSLEKRVKDLEDQVKEDLTSLTVHRKLIQKVGDLEASQIDLWAFIDRNFPSASTKNCKHCGAMLRSKDTTKCSMCGRQL